MCSGVLLLSLKNNIANLQTDFTPTDCRIAEVVLDDLTLLTFGNVSELAASVGTSRASIVRFATKLGFSGYSELQQSAREEVAAQLTSPSQRVRSDDSIEPVQYKIEHAVQATFASLDRARIVDMASQIAVAENVWILSGETSMAGAIVLNSGLAMIRKNVQLVHEHSTSRELCGATRLDVAVVFDFSRYRRNVISSARILEKHDVPLVAITDSPLSPLAALTSSRCELDIPAVGPFDSSIPAVLAAELLVAQVVLKLGESAMVRIDQLESFWQSTDIFLE